MGAVAGVEVPETVRSFARAAGADDWLAALPDLVARLERDWRITIGAVYPDATEALVAAATLADGTPAVLKLLMQRGHGRHRIGLPIEQRHEILCRVAMRLWRPAPDSGLPTGAEKAARLGPRRSSPPPRWPTALRRCSSC